MCKHYYRAMLIGQGDFVEGADDDAFLQVDGEYQQTLTIQVDGGDR